MENPTDIAVRQILALHTDGPLRIGVDGRSAAGKTTFADGLSERLHSARRTVLRASIDDFHPPGHGARSAGGGYTVESYYAEGYDYAAFRDLLLAPLDSGGDRRCRLGLHDSFSDTAIDHPAVAVPADAIVVVDGCFLLRSELRGFWEFVIWLDVSFETMIERAAKRDIAWMPSEEEVRARYRDRWIPLHSLYEQTGARGYADMIIDNEDVRAPRCVLATDQIRRTR
jgi:uridine kinase